MMYLANRRSIVKFCSIRQVEPTPFKTRNVAPDSWIEKTLTYVAFDSLIAKLSDGFIHHPLDLYAVVHAQHEGFVKRVVGVAGIGI